MVSKIKGIDLAARCGFVLVALAVTLMPLALIFGKIGIDVFLAVITIWLLVAIMLICGTSITEVTVWKASIKRDVRAAQEAADESAQILANLRSITRLVIENEYILVSGSQLAIVGHPAVGHINRNLDMLTSLIPITGDELVQWQAQMQALMRQWPSAPPQSQPQ
ncbi:hypothetical protein [Pseudomonas oryzihabitans]|uniref:hypothetical protein n=1 Tax=Pseudomonas oryzihabitans TaxID=47885 RepID=UPI001ABF87CE|nr:hypothetical protein [Pseudomonas oryzihabitans]